MQGLVVMTSCSARRRITGRSASSASRAVVALCAASSSSSRRRRKPGVTAVTGTAEVGEDVEAQAVLARVDRSLPVALPAARPHDAGQGADRPGRAGLGDRHRRRYHRRDTDGSAGLRGRLVHGEGGDGRGPPRLGLRPGREGRSQVVPTAAHTGAEDAATLLDGEGRRRPRAPATASAPAGGAGVAPVPVPGACQRERVEGARLHPLRWESGLQCPGRRTAVVHRPSQPVG